MSKIECSYNFKHKFDIIEKRLYHESQCPDKEKRKDLTVCPYTNLYVIKKTQLKFHKKNCDHNKPKKDKKEEEEKNDNGNNNYENVNINGDNIFDDNNSEKQNDINKNLENIFNFDDLDTNKNVFDEEDFIFKQCYQ